MRAISSLCNSLVLLNHASFERYICSVRVVSTTVGGPLLKLGPASCEF
jgi:hypothetical protein